MPLSFQPIFPSLEIIKLLTRENCYQDDVSCIRSYIDSCGSDIPGVDKDYRAAIGFLKAYSRKSDQTFMAFRTEIERLLLWSWLVARKAVTSLNAAELVEYFEFCAAPPIDWVGTLRVKHFVEQDNGVVAPNPAWRPFRASKEGFDARAGKYNRKFSLTTRKKQAAILNVFFDYMINMDDISKNPVFAAKKSLKVVTDNSTESKRMLSETNWSLVVSILTELADVNPKFERNLFVIVTLKSLYLRISEISWRSRDGSEDDENPRMSNFTRDASDPNIVWFKAFGKRNKIRSVSVPPDYLKYLGRYRRSRGYLADFPAVNDEKPLISRMGNDTHSGLTVRQTTRIVEESIKLVCETLAQRGNQQAASDISVATTHWFRHTGASMDIDVRPLKHISEDLGHSSIGTTDRIYVHAEDKARAKSGNLRKV